jgi:hypothetical protein
MRPALWCCVPLPHSRTGPAQRLQQGQRATSSTLLPLLAPQRHRGSKTSCAQGMRGWLRVAHDRARKQ